MVHCLIYWTIGQFIPSGLVDDDDDDDDDDWKSAEGDEWSNYLGTRDVVNFGDAVIVTAKILHDPSPLSYCRLTSCSLPSSTARSGQPCSPA